MLQFTIMNILRNSCENQSGNNLYLNTQTLILLLVHVCRFTFRFVVHSHGNQTEIQNSGVWNREEVDIVWMGGSACHSFFNR